MSYPGLKISLGRGIPATKDYLSFFVDKLMSKSNSFGMSDKEPQKKMPEKAVLKKGPIRFKHDKERRGSPDSN